MPVVGSFHASPLSAVVRKILSSHTTGDDHPRPGTSTDHATFSVVDHRSGNSAPSAMPSDSGPRNCGQRSPGFVVTPEVEKRTIAQAAAASTRWGCVMLKGYDETCRSASLMSPVVCFVG
jgi:hypothetical protein